MCTPGPEEEVWGLQVLGCESLQQGYPALLTRLLPTQIFVASQMVLMRKPFQQAAKNFPAFEEKFFTARVMNLRYPFQQGSPGDPEQSCTPGPEEEVWGRQVLGCERLQQEYPALLTWLLPTQAFFTSQMIMMMMMMMMMMMIPFQQWTRQFSNVRPEWVTFTQVPMGTAGSSFPFREPDAEGDSDAKGPQVTMSKAAYLAQRRTCGGCRNTLGSDDSSSSHPAIFNITDDDDDDDDDTFSAGSEEPSFLRRGLHPLTKLFWPAQRSDFKKLKKEVSKNVKAAKLSKDMWGAVFSNLLAMLGHREALQDLMDTLEQEPDGHLEGPGGTILTELRKDSRYPEVGSKCFLLYLLEALMVLSDIQHDLLAQSMEKRILVPQRDLVKSILKPNFNCFQNIPFTLQPKLLAPLDGEGLVITYGLLNECGLKMKRESLRSTWTPKAKEPLSALYGALSVLTQLAEA
ncbi:hypothetical protein QTO34_007570 [Cnephaeus nilssonii]|uniref:Gasdermin PUB domain-containing protein n=1 Tax=Cnephaeus nilssonii TaxID=3371016 RepID=A0AA40HIL0_CNENI|nr:hypothetical protein QTO34_007570 [Eptesicus nilssonii]